MHTRVHDCSHSSVFVLQDRVMINRMDNICEAVMKGKWPSNRRQFFDFPGLLPGYSSMATDTPLQRRSLGDITLVGQTSYSGSEDLTMSPQVNKASPTHNLKCFALRLCARASFILYHKDQFLHSSRFMLIKHIPLLFRMKL